MLMLIKRYIYIIYSYYYDNMLVLYVRVRVCSIIYIYIHRISNNYCTCFYQYKHSTNKPAHPNPWYALPFTCSSAIQPSNQPYIYHVNNPNYTLARPPCPQWTTMEWIVLSNGALPSCMQAIPLYTHANLPTHPRSCFLGCSIRRAPTYHPIPPLSIHYLKRH